MLVNRVLRIVLFMLVHQCALSQYFLRINSSIGKVNITLNDVNYKAPVTIKDISKGLYKLTFKNNEINFNGVINVTKNTFLNINKFRYSYLKLSVAKSQFSFSEIPKVLIINNIDTLVSDAGEFKIYKFFKDNKKITISSPGYLNFIDSIKINPFEIIYQNIQLDETVDFKNYLISNVEKTRKIIVNTSSSLIGMYFLYSTISAFKSNSKAENIYSQYLSKTNPESVSKLYNSYKKENLTTNKYIVQSVITGLITTYLIFFENWSNIDRIPLKNNPVTISPFIKFKNESLIIALNLKMEF